MKRSTLVVVLLAALTMLPFPACTGNPDPDLPPGCDVFPWPWCPSPPGTAYDCDNPPEASGVVLSRDPVPDQWIVRFYERSGFSVSEDEATFAASKPGVANVLVMKHVLAGFTATISDPTSVKAIAARPDVQAVYQATRVHLLDAPSGLIGNLDRVDQRTGKDGVYAPRSDGSDAVVYVVDTGGWEHPDYHGCVDFDHGWGIDGTWRDDHGHGTHVAGTICSTTYGMAKGATVIPVRVLRNGSGSDADVLAGIDYAIEDSKRTPDKLHLINMSLGGPADDAMDIGVCKAREANILSVVASGNDTGDACNTSPARVKQALTMNAMDDRDDRIAGFSNYGPCTDLYAPGWSILSTAKGGGSTTMSGTSMASPHGVAAGAIIGTPEMSPDQVKAAVLEAATPDVIGDVQDNTPNEMVYVGPED